MKDSTILALGAMVCGVVFGWICLQHSMDHVIAAAIAAGIFGVAGYEIKAWREKK